MAKQPNRILMCPPDYFTVEYEINPWMDANALVDQDLAKEQWTNLHQEISRIYPKIELLTPQPGLPDLVFCDAGFLYKNVFIPSRFRYQERQKEADVFANWFAQNGYEIRYIEADMYFEGHGDDLWVDDDTVYCGYGFRSNKETFDHLQNILSDIGKICLKTIELTDPRFYHLDTCFTPLTKNLALIYKPAISQQSIKMLEQTFELIEITDEDAFKFACNTIVLGKHLILPSASKNLQDTLRQKGFHIHIIDVSEFIKAGGACKCMAMIL